MGYVQKRSGRYRARYRDPVGRMTSKTFARKADAERFLNEMQVDLARGAWIDPRGAEMALADWAEEFLSLARRLSHHRRGRPMSVTSGSTSFRASARIDSGASQPTRSRTG